MDNVPSQGSREVDYPFRNTYTKKVQPDKSALSNPDLKFESAGMGKANGTQLTGELADTSRADSPILDETIEIVKDKVWTFRSALKAAAEALVHFGLPPQVVGYEYPYLPVSCSEYSCMTEVGPQTIFLRLASGVKRHMPSVPLGEDDQLAKKNEGEAALQKVAEDEMKSRNSSYGSKSKVNGRGEGSSLVRRPDDEDDTNHAFAEAVRKEKEERKSLTRTYEFDEDEDEDGKGS